MQFHVSIPPVLAVSSSFGIYERNRDSLSFQFQDFREYGYDGVNRLQKINEHRFDLATLIRMTWPTFSSLSARHHRLYLRLHEPHDDVSSRDAAQFRLLSLKVLDPLFVQRR